MKINDEKLEVILKISVAIFIYEKEEKVIYTHIRIFKSNKKNKNNPCYQKWLRKFHLKMRIKMSLERLSLHKLYFNSL